MRFTRRIAKRLATAPIFGGTDRRLSRTLEPSDAIVVAGFWRSGTTLLLETVAHLANGRSFFEPLHFRVPAARPFHSAHRFEARGRRLGETCPYVSPESSSSPMDDFLDAMLRGALSDSWTRKARRMPHLFSRQVVVKLVRGNLLLGYLEARFRPTTVFIFRHPAAVIASFRRGRANRAIYTSEEFLEILLRQAPLQNDFLAEHEDHIARWKGSPLHRLALAHSIANTVPLAQIAAGKSNACLVHFETLATATSDTIDRVRRHLEAHSIPTRPLPPSGILGADSLTTQRARERVPAPARSHTWKNELSAKEIDDIHSIAEGFGSPLVEAIRTTEEGLAERDAAEDDSSSA